MRHFKGLKGQYDDDDLKLFIRLIGNRFCVTVEPEYRFNGTQNLDGMFPRYYKSVGAAKGAVTRMLGSPVWTPIDKGN